MVIAPPRIKLALRGLDFREASIAESAVASAVRTKGRRLRGTSHSAGGFAEAEVLGVLGGQSPPEVVKPTACGKDLPADADVLKADARAASRQDSAATPPPDAVGRGPPGGDLRDLGQ